MTSGIFVSIESGGVALFLDSKTQTVHSSAVAMLECKDVVWVCVFLSRGGLSHGPEGPLPRILSQGVAFAKQGVQMSSKGREGSNHKRLCCLARDAPFLHT